MEIKPMVFMQQMLELPSVRNWNSRLRSRDAGALIHCIMCFLDKKYYWLKKHTHSFNYKHKLCQNAALSLNGMHLNIPSTECSTLCRAESYSGTAWVGQCLCEVARSFGNPSDTWQWWNDHSSLWYLNVITIPPFVCPKLTCVKLLIC